MTETGEEVQTRGAAVGARDPAPGGPWWWVRPRGFVLDVSLAALSALECGFAAVGFADRTGVPALVAVLLGTLAGGLLLVRRRWPIVVVLVSIAIIPAEMGYLLSIVGLYTVAASEVPRRITALLTGMLLLGTVVVTFSRMRQDIGQTANFDPQWWFLPLMAGLMSVVLTVPPVLTGLYVAARRRWVESIRDRADGLERELSLLAERAEERAEWARNEERTRIAREMHDVVAHRVSLMVVHAAALQTVALKDPEKAVKNAALVGDMGRHALTELRTMLGVLRADETTEATDTAESDAGSADEAAEPPTGSGDGVQAVSGAGASSERLAVPTEPAAPTDPPTSRPSGKEPCPGQEHAGAYGGTAATDGAAPKSGAGPRLSELTMLVGQSREAGMTVELSEEGAPRGYAEGVEQTAYRVVQEALTNVHKHAAGAGTRVRLAHREGEVALQVENDAPARERADAGLPSGGNGLVGMRERVTTLGGVFVSGPTEGGGFRVSAVIPG